MGLSSLPQNSEALRKARRPTHKGAGYERKSHFSDSLSATTSLPSLPRACRFASIKSARMVAAVYSIGLSDCSFNDRTLTPVADETV